MDRSLDGQVAVVTGAGTGLGAAFVGALSAAGASIVLMGRRPEALQKVAAKHPGNCVCLACDVREESSVREAVAAAARQWGRIDILVNNAGVYRTSPIEKTVLADFDDIMATNLRGAFLAAQACWPHLIASRGQIVNVSSIAGSQGFRDTAAYCASKFGLNGLSDVLALEGKPHGIRVLCICPGAVATPLWDAHVDDATQHRMIKPEPIADLVRWLAASPRNFDFGRVTIVNFDSPFVD